MGHNSALYLTLYSLKQAVIFYQTLLKTRRSTLIWLSIKGWLDDKGKIHEKIYNVAWSGKRELDDNGNLPALKNTVHVSQARYTNTVGITNSLLPGKILTTMQVKQPFIMRESWKFTRLDGQPMTLKPWA